MISDDKFMHEALQLAGRSNPSPNPRVGCVIVSKGSIVGRGYHRFFGDSHAEIHAINEAKARAKGATMYVTLEPCDHQGKTPPCTNAIIKAGIRSVVIAMQDPHKLVKGRGIRRLRCAGLKVEVGLGRELAIHVNRAWIKYISTGLPFVTIKAAMSLDGKMAASSGHSRWITSTQSRKYVHHLRNNNDAILVGVQTVIKDNPRLTTRIKGGHDPIRVIIDSKLRTPLDAKVLKDENAIIITTSSASSIKSAKLKNKGIRVINAGKGKQVNLKHALSALAKIGVTSILVEGGPSIHTHFLEKNLADIGYFFIAPMIIGGGGLALFNDKRIKSVSQAKTFDICSVKTIGKDVLIKAVF